MRGTRSLVGESRVDGRLLALACPQTYVNDSGAAASALVRRFGIEDLRRLVVVHDDLDLPVGRVRLKVGGGTAGHNGLDSLRSHLHDSSFVRVRIGIGKPPSTSRGADYVLRAPPKAERAPLEGAVGEAADAVEAVLEGGADRAMNRFNTSQ